MALLILLMVIFFAVPVYCFWKGLQVFFWKTTIGEVVSATVKPDKFENRIRYYPEIIYRYTVAEKFYENDQFAAGAQQLFATSKEVEKKCAQFPPGKSITVYYNPRKPKESALEQFSFAFILFGSITAFGALLCYAFVTD